MRLFCFSPLIPRINNVTTYFSDGIFIILGIYYVTLGSRINDAKNLPAIALFCLSSNHFGYGL
jgi:hypothetical protein